MDAQIALLLAQDGLVNGAVYGLMALALVLVFSVTRVIVIPQGEFVAFGALSMAVLHAGRVPATLWLLLALAVFVLVGEAWRGSRGAAGEGGAEGGGRDVPRGDRKAPHKGGSVLRGIDRHPLRRRSWRFPHI